MNNYSLFPVSGLNTCNLKHLGIEVCEIKNRADIIKTYNRVNFYKIGLIVGESIIHYADKEIEMEDANLVFSNSFIAYNWKFISAEQNGYACFFTKDFLKMPACLNIVQQSHLFAVNRMPVFPLNNKQENFIAAIFWKMMSEQHTDYIFKDELMHDYISVIIHEALKMKVSKFFLI